MMEDIYISGPLTQVPHPEEAKKFYESIAAVCEELGFSVYVPHQHTDPIQHPDVTPAEVYTKDYNQIAQAKMIIALVDVPSVGVGMEIEIAKNNNTKIILLYHKEAKVGRMTRGNPGITHTIVYENHADALMQLKTILPQ